MIDGRKLHAFDIFKRWELCWIFLWIRGIIRDFISPTLTHLCCILSIADELVLYDIQTLIMPSSLQQSRNMHLSCTKYHIPQIYISAMATGTQVMYSEIKGILCIQRKNAFCACMPDLKASLHMINNNTILKPFDSLSWMEIASRSLSNERQLSKLVSLIYIY